MKFPIVCLLALSATSPVLAELELPEGKGLPLSQGIQTDTIDVETSIVGSYLIPDMLDFQALEEWRKILPSSRFSFDTRSKTYSSRAVGRFVRTDSAGLAKMVVASATYDAGGATKSVTYRGYDGQGRRRVEYVFDLLDPGVGVDSTHWVWTHEGCADELRSDRRWIWTVDEEGRCLDGSFQAPDFASVSGWKDLNRLHLVWKGARLAQAFGIEAGDTVAREEYTYESDGRILMIRTFSPSAGGWYLAEHTTFVYSGTELLKVVAEGFDSTGTLFASAVMSGRRPMAAGTADEFAKARVPFAAIEAGTAVFGNPSTESVNIELFDPSGRRLESFLLEAGSSRRIGSVAAGWVLWTARGKNVAASGRVLVGR